MKKVNWKWIKKEYRKKSNNLKWKRLFDERT